MYPYYTGYVANMKLHSDDINGIRSLYGRTRTLYIYNYISAQLVKYQYIMKLYNYNQYKRIYKAKMFKILQKNKKRTFST